MSLKAEAIVYRKFSGLSFSPTTSAGKAPLSQIVQLQKSGASLSLEL